MIQIDEWWSFVEAEVQVQWVWVAWGGDTRRVLGMVVGGRSTATARRLWAAIPADHRADATVFTDYRASYRKAVPTTSHSFARNVY